MKIGILGRADRIPEALAAIEQALEIDPKNLDALRTKAETLCLLGRAQEALRLLERALRQDPTDALTLRLKDYALIDMERYSEALATLQQAIVHNQDDTSLLAAIAFTYQQLDEYTQAWETACQARQMQPRDPWILTIYASVASGIGDYQAAVSALEQIAEPSVDTWLSLGWAYENLPQADRAREAYEHALASVTYPDTLWARICSLVGRRTQTRSRGIVQFHVLANTCASPS